MGVYSIPVTIGVNEEQIAKNIENEVKDRVISNITEVVEEVIYGRKYWGISAVDKKDLSPLKDFVSDVVEEIVNKHEKYIVEAAVDRLSDKLSRKKKTKELLAKKIENMEVLNETDRGS